MRKLAGRATESASWAANHPWTKFLVPAIGTIVSLAMVGYMSNGFTDFGIEAPAQVATAVDETAATSAEVAQVPNVNLGNILPILLAGGVAAYGAYETFVHSAPMNKMVSNLWSRRTARA